MGHPRTDHDRLDAGRVVPEISPTETVIAFLSAHCDLCEQVQLQLVISAGKGAEVRVFVIEEDREQFSAFEVRKTRSIAICRNQQIQIALRGQDCLRVNELLSELQSSFS